MKRISTLLLIIFLLICVSGCQQPVGGFSDGKGGKGVDLNFMWLVPSRLQYETEQSLDKYNDFQILLAKDGKVQEISATHSNIKVEVLYFDAQIDEPEPVPVTNRFFLFVMPGRHAVKVTYKEGTKDEESAKYSVEVRGTFTGGGEGSDFFDMIWM